MGEFFKCTEVYITYFKIYPRRVGGPALHDEEVASKKNKFKTRVQNSIPYFDPNGRNTLPFGAAHTYIVCIREYPPPGILPTHFALCSLF